MAISCSSFLVPDLFITDCGNDRSCYFYWFVFYRHGTFHIVEFTSTHFHRHRLCPRKIMERRTVGGNYASSQEFQRETPNGIWKNKLFSVQSSPFSSYEWEDIHIQGLFGDIHIDVTDTVLPKGTSLISVRQGIGKIKIELPYEIPVRIHYTTLIGDAKLFDISPKTAH